MSNKVESLVVEIKKLANIAMSKPQAAYAIFTHGFTERWTYLLRTIPDISNMLQPLEDSIRHKLLPALTGRSAFSNVERDLISLPARLGGLGIQDPTKVAKQQFENSSMVSSPLTSNICQQRYTCNDEIRRSQEQAKNEVHRNNRKSTLEFAETIRAKLSKSQQISMEQSSERGASAWLTAIPLSEFGFSLSKQAFRDALCIRYGWQPANIPSHCSCGNPFRIAHAFSCPKGAFPSLRHNRVRDILGQLLSEVCPNVEIEPRLQPLSGETFPMRSANTEDDARLDLKAQNFWDRSNRCAYFDVRIFNSFAPSNCKSSSQSCYRKHEQEKRRAYEARVIEVERGTFSPIVLSTCGGCSPTTSVVLKRLADMISSKHGKPYNQTIQFIRCKISFSLIDSAILCLRGARSACHRPEINFNDNPIDVIVNEAHITQ